MAIDDPEKPGRLTWLATCSGSDYTTYCHNNWLLYKENVPRWGKECNDNLGSENEFKT